MGVGYRGKQGNKYSYGLTCMIEEELIKDGKLKRHQGACNVLSKEATPHPAVIIGKTDDWLILLFLQGN